MKSPVTRSPNIEEIDRIPSSDIVNLYEKQLQMDVSEYFKDIPEIKILRCNDTGYRYYYPETIFGDAAFYEELQQKDFYYNTVHWEHHKAQKFIAASDSVLEVGCGLGFFMEHLKARGITAAGLELNPKAVEVSRQKKLNVVNELIQEHADKHSAVYDVVCSFQVLEHIYDIKGYIDGCCKALKPGGKLIFAVPHSNPYFLKYDRMHTLNLPPHHAGLWNKNAFNSLPAWFPLKTIGVYIEPLTNRNVYVESYLRNKGKNKILKFYKKIHPGITNRLLSPLRLFVEGKCIVAIYEKI